MKIGDRLPALTFPAIDKAALARFAEAASGRSAAGTDVDHVRENGLRDVVVHEMLSMAYLGRFLTARFDQSRLRHFAVRFVGVTLPEDEISCSGEVIELFDAGCERRARLEIRATSRSGESKAVGEAVVSL